MTPVLPGRATPHRTRRWQATAATAVLTALLLPAPAALHGAHHPPRIAVAAAPDDSARIMAAVLGLFRARAEFTPWTLSDSAEVTRPDEQVVRGREAREQLQALAEQFDVRVTTTVTRFSVQAAGAEVGGRHVGTISRRGGAEVARMDDRFSAVLLREPDGQWRITQLVWDGPRVTSTGSKRPDGFPPFLHEKAPAPSAVTTFERASAANGTRLVRAAYDSARRAERLTDSVRSAAGCSGHPTETNAFSLDTVYFTLNNAVEADSAALKGSLAGPAALELVSRWTPPDPFTPPVARFLATRGQEKLGLRSFAFAAAFTLMPDGRIRDRQLAISSAWPALDASVLATLARADSEDALAGVIARDSGVRLTLTVQLFQAPGFNAPAMKVRNHIEGGFEPATPNQDRVWLEYPPDMVSQKKEGDVVTQYVVTREGKVDPRTVSIVSSPSPSFSRAVEKWLGQLTFQPARLAGCPVGLLVQNAFAFAISDVGRKLYPDPTGNPRGDPRGATPAPAIPDVRRPLPDGSRPPH